MKFGDAQRNVYTEIGVYPVLLDCRMRLVFNFNSLFVF